MSQIVKTDAIVLKSMKYRETSRIVTFYTKQFGKVSGIVKGARQVKNKYGSSLQPMSYVSLVFYKKEGRDLQTVTQCDLVKSYRHLAEDMERMAVGMAMIELIANIAYGEEENVPLFTLLVDSLTAVNDATKSPPLLLYHFELRLAAVLGFQPRFEACISCRTAVQGEDSSRGIITYHLGRGGPLCENCSSVPGPLRRLSAQTLRALKDLSRCESPEQVLTIDLGRQTMEEINGFLMDFLRHHIAGMRSLRSNKVFSQIFDTC